MKTLSELKKGDIISYIYPDFGDVYNLFIDTMLIKEISLTTKYIILTTTVLETTSPDLTLIDYTQDYFIPKFYHSESCYNNFLFSNEVNDINLRKMEILSRRIKTLNEEIRRRKKMLVWPDFYLQKTK